MGKSGACWRCDSGGAEVGGDRARAWATSQHGVAGTEAQRGALRWMVSSAARATTGPRAALSVAAQQPIWTRALGASGRVLREEWSPEQVSGHLRLKRELAISHETIYRHIWQDLRSGGTLHQHLRGARKSCRKRYGRCDSRGRLAGKRMMGERPASVERRRQIGHWEIDTMMGESPGESSHCVLTLVERKSGLPHAGASSAHRCRNQPRVAGPDGAASGADAHHHGRQRNRVPLVWPGGSSQSGQVLLRHPASQLGARDQREHQRTHPAVSAQRSDHGPSYPKRVRLNRRTPQQPTKKRHGYKTPNQCSIET